MSLRSVAACLGLACLSLALLPTAADAQTGSYTWTTYDANHNITAQSPAYTGGTGYPSFIAPPPRYQNVTFTDTNNLYTGVAGDSGGNDMTAAVSVSPLTATFTWSDPNNPADPPPPSVIIMQTCTASATGAGWISPPNPPTGSCNDGLGQSSSVMTFSDTGNWRVGSLSVSGTLYTVQAGGQSFTLSNPPSPSASAASPGAPLGVATIKYSAAATGVTVSPSGTYSPAKGDYRVLTGQQITAALNGIPANFTVTSYAWSIKPSATCFKTYNEKAVSNQLVPLGTSDLTGPAVGSASVAPFAFYDSAQENLTVTCAVTMTAPDGKTVLNVTATSPQISVLKPTASWGIDPKTVPVNGEPDNTYVGFQDNSKTATQSYGAVTFWYPVTITMPPPFTTTGGQGCFAQISTPINSVTRKPTGKGASTYNLKVQNAQGIWIAPGKGLDKGFPYPEGYVIDAKGNITDNSNDSTFTVGNIGGSGDAPSAAENPPDQDNGGTNWMSGVLNESFATWLMYKPTGGVWIPLQMATWSVVGTASGGPNTWSATGTYKAPAPSNTASFPQWNIILSGLQYQP